MNSVPRKPNPRSRQRSGMIAGLTLSAIAVAILVSTERFHAPGPMNPGHADIKCADCHRAASGSLRQQVQATVQYWTGMRQSPAAVGHRPVSNEHCLDCHERAKDRHPVYRFLEPRYTKARKEIAPQYCNSCHREHRGARLTIAGAFCSTCHGKLALKKDPLDISHKKLVKTAQWKTCLGCHDFHGNHRMKTREVVAARIPEDRLAQYFVDAPSPYSQEKRYKARKELDRTNER